MNISLHIINNRTAVLFSSDLIHLYRPSINCHLLAVPPCAKSSFASWAFYVSSSSWHSLPLHICSSCNATFKSRLKAHLFSSAYHV